MTYKPPFSITPCILKLSQRIYHTLGILEGEKLDAGPIKLRRKNNIKTIQTSLAIEGNSLSLEQVTDIFEGKKVLGPKRDIIEVQNAILIYEKFDQLNPTSIQDF
jgi:Fic family protein